MAFPSHCREQRVMRKLKSFMARYPNTWHVFIHTCQLTQPAQMVQIVSVLWWHFSQYLMRITSPCPQLTMLAQWITNWMVFPSLGKPKKQSWSAGQKYTNLYGSIFYLWRIHSHLSFMVVTFLIWGWRDTSDKRQKLFALEHTDACIFN